MSRLGRDYAYRKARERVLRDATVCHLCGGALDFDAEPRSRWAPSVDHVLPVSSLVDLDPRSARKLAVDPELLRPAHVGCNSRRGDGRRDQAEHTSRGWTNAA
jgi:hypothetical protein